MDMTTKEQEFVYTHGIAPGLGSLDVLVAWVVAALVVCALTAVI